MTEHDKATEQALDTVAREYAAALVRRHADSEDDWENYPDLGMYDFMEVTERAERLAEEMRPEKDAYDKAYKRLSARGELTTELAPVAGLAGEVAQYLNKA